MYKRKNEILAYNPYMHNFGGGEKYFIDVLNVLSNSGKDVILYTPYSLMDINNHLLNRFGYKLSSKISVKKPPFNNKFVSYLYLSFLTSQYKKFFCVTNQYPQISFSKDSYCVVQFPYFKSGFTGFLRKNIHYIFYKKIFVYSKYVKQVLIHLHRSLESKVLVVPPYVEAPQVLGKVEKSNTILCIGRFIENENSKGQQYAIEAFKDLLNFSKIKNLKLCLVGGSTLPNSKFIQNLVSGSKGLPVEFYINATDTTKKNLLKSSSIYWHLAGYNKDLTTNPGSAEHFGITVLEAICHDLVPLCYKAGGPIEIVGEGGKYLLFESLKDLVKKTDSLLSSEGLKKNYSAVCSK
jgi:glycosyltransferase involved in cell wall biosynthesis